MVLDVIVNNSSISLQIENPFHPDLEAIMARIERAASSHAMDISGLDIRGLIPKMIKGIAGCERGCPANAKGFAAKGFKNFTLQYIEGGILSAHASMEDGKAVTLKMFPDF
ncbi:MAG TPA: hypothetical protein VEI46_02655 [Thermodesulfovibrionales bacterium]|nr:hypothetical protein [Thermodesulfovibrionales bacterium]